MPKTSVIVAGCGVMARTWVEYTLKRDDMAIIGLVDPNPEAAGDMKALFGLDCPDFRDIHEALNAKRPDIVYDISIPGAHPSVSITAMRAGCDVLSEKPIASGASSAWDIVHVSTETGRFYAVMQNRRYLSGTRDISAFLSDGPMGRPGLVCADFFIGAHFEGFRNVMDDPLIMEMSIHTFDMARCMLQADAKSVYCTAFNTPGSWYKGCAAALCTFEMTDGTLFSYRGSWTGEGFPTTWEADWRIQCEKGTVIWNGRDNPRARISDPDDPRSREPGRVPYVYVCHDIDVPRVYAGPQGHYGCLDAMLKARAEGKKAETCGENNIMSTLMALAAVKSAREGRKVEMTEFM